MYNTFLKINYKCYCFFIRYKIKNINNINDIINIIKNLSYLYDNSDKILEVLVDCLIIYPIDIKESEKISIIQQQYIMTNGIEDYCSTVLWLSIVQSIIELNKVPFVNT